MKANDVKKMNDLNVLAADIQKSFGPDSARVGGLQKALRTIPTGSMALDYELGVGGWPLGKLVGVFGPRDIGKSSMIGLNAVRNAQAMGLTSVWIALEAFDEKWARKNGVDTDNMLITYPLTGEEAFAIALKCIKNPQVDLVIFDSIGAVLSEGEMDSDSKPRQGGQAGLITWFVKAAAPTALRNDVCIILLNHIRDNMKSQYAHALQQPGGHAIEHMESIIVQLKRGKNQYTVKESGTDVVIGQEIVAHILRNKESEGTGRKAVFDYFHAETGDYPFGIDEFTDIINTAKRTGVIKTAGSYFDLPNGKRIQGLKAVSEYLDANPVVMAEVREKVLEAMLQRNQKTTLKAVGDAEEVG